MLRAAVDRYVRGRVPRLGSEGGDKCRAVTLPVGSAPPCRNHICCCSARTCFHPLCEPRPTSESRLCVFSFRRQCDNQFLCSHQSREEVAHSHRSRLLSFFCLSSLRRCFRLAMTDMEDTLARIPNDILVDSVLAACSPQSLAALGATSRRWHDFVAVAGSPCEILWQRRAVQDFKFPAHSTGRRTGWYRLYSQLASSSALVWGVSLWHSLLPRSASYTRIHHSRLTLQPPTRRRTRTGGWGSRPSDGPPRRGSRILSAVV